MNFVAMSDVRELASIEDGRCVSIYMPTHPTGREGRQDVVRLKNLITAAEEQLVDRGMRTVNAREFLTPVEELPHRAEWAHRKQGLAVFRSQNSFSHYWLDIPVEENLVVGRQFYVKSILPAIGAKPEFFVLVISRNNVRLLKAADRRFERLQPVGLPTNMKQGLNLQVVDRGEQVHSGMRGDIGKEAGVFHGQGGHRDTLKDELVEYFRLINQSIWPALRDTQWPLILAGVEYEMAIFRHVSDYAHVVGEALYGGFDYASDETLYERALPIAQRFFDTDRHTAIKQYGALVDRRLASDDIKQIIPAAYEGRIDTLLVDCDAELFGQFDPEKKTIGIVNRPAPDLDLVELAVIQTIRHAGKLYVVERDELPSAGPMCAMFRY